MTLPEPLLERSRDKKRSRDRAEVDERPQTGGHRDGADRGDVLGDEVRDAMQLRPVDRDVAMLGDRYLDE